MNQKVILVFSLGVLLLLLSAGFFWGDAARPALSGNEHTVLMTEAGFSPSELSIKAGDRVIFSNVGSSTERWPASDLHPTHELYRAFDPLRPVLPGESWAFVFEEAGNWRFHDHLHANKRGIIRVSP